MTLSLNRAQFIFCPKFELNTDLKGNDLKFTYKTESPEECAYLCSLLYNTCNGFTFWNITSPSNNCFLKSFVSLPAKYYAVGRKFMLKD